MILCRVRAFGRHNPVEVLEATQFGRGLTHAQPLGVSLNGRCDKTLELRAVMMHIVIGEDNLHGIILEHLKHLFHNLFERASERLDAALFVVVADKAFAERKIHSRKVGRIVYV